MSGNIRRAGFTLIEVMLAVAIFLILVGAVFFSVGVATRAAAELGEEQIGARRVDAFLRYCRTGFANLPSTADLQLRARDAGRLGRIVEIVITGAPGAFSAGSTDAMGPHLILAALPDGRGHATMSITRYPGRLSGRELEHHLSRADWQPLLDEIEKLQWLFWSDLEGDFVETWEPGQGLPSMVTLNFRQAGHAEISATFRIPAARATVAQ